EAIRAIEHERAEAGRPKPSRRRWLIATAACVLVAAGLTAGLAAWLLPTPSHPLPPEEEPGKVTFDLDEDDGRLTIRQGEEEKAINLKAEKTYSLAPGSYTIQPTVRKDGRHLLPEMFTVSPGETKTVALRLVGEIRNNPWHSHPVCSLAMSPKLGELL